MKTRTIQRRKQRSRKKQLLAEQSSEMRQFVTVARARQAAATGRSDLPMDPLGYAFGHNLISQAEYDAGRLFERLQTKVYGKPHAKCGTLDSTRQRQAAPENNKDREEKNLLDRMVSELKKIGRLSIVRDMCFYHLWRQRKFSNLREGLEHLTKI